jgi:hypothetical protein
MRQFHGLFRKKKVKGSPRFVTQHEAPWKRKARGRSHTTAITGNQRAMNRPGPQAGEAVWKERACQAAGADAQLRGSRGGALQWAPAAGSWMSAALPSRSGMTRSLATSLWAFRRFVVRRPIPLAYVSLTILPVVEATTRDELRLDARAMRQQSCAWSGKRVAVDAQHS